jgi:antirestriction protein ArdC
LDQSLASINALLAEMPEVHLRAVPEADIAPEIEVAEVEVQAEEQSPKGRERGSKRDVAREVTDSILAAMAEGVVPWQSHVNAGGWQLPKSMSSEKHYQGSNIWALEASAQIQHFASHWWGTYRQIEELGGRVRKGEHGTLITFWKTVDDEEKMKEKGEKVEESRRGFRKGYKVFNAEQCDNLPERYTKIAVDLRSEHERIAAAEVAIQNYIENDGPELVHAGAQPRYNYGADRVTVPDLELFDDAGDYYAAVFHELTHSTGHESRLNRAGFTEHAEFGSQCYAVEELVAELGSAMSLAAIGVEADRMTQNSAAYIDNWMQALRNDKNLIFRASTDAHKAIKRIGLDLDLEIAHEEVVAVEAIREISEQPVTELDDSPDIVITPVAEELVPLVEPDVYEYSAPAFTLER